MFFRAIRDKDAHGRKSVKYDHIVIKEAGGEVGYDVEQQPTHIIPGDTIESIVVRKTKKYGNSQKDKKVQRAFEKIPESFNVEFKIKSPESEKFSSFTKRNSQEFFSMSRW